MTDFIPSDAAPERLDERLAGNERMSWIRFPNGSWALLTPSTGLIEPVLRAAFQTWQETRDGGCDA